MEVLQYSRFAALAEIGIADDFDEEKSFDVPDVSYVLDWINNMENCIN
jgi:hypothetical protein